VVLIAITLVSLWTTHLRVCVTGEAATTCRPLELTDPPIVLTVLLVLGLAFPDIKTLKLPGGFELERDVIGPHEDLMSEEMF
jgi:hypothetical protein